MTIRKQTTDQARFRSDAMGKADLFRGVRMFVGLNGFEPGQEHAAHIHADQDKLYVVLEGSGELTVGSETTQVQVGDTAFAAAGVTHAVRNTGTQRLVLLVAISPGL